MNTVWHWEKLEKNRLTIFGRNDYWAFQGYIKMDGAHEVLAMSILKEKYPDDEIRIVKTTTEYFT